MSVSTLSVILPTYNCRSLIQRHLNEARSWLGLASEIIVVDSFSTDGTIELIRQELQHPKLTIISRERGLYESWNEAIQVSRSDWIYISTAGDGIKRSHLQHLIETGCRLQADVVVSNARFISEDGRPCPRLVWPARKLMLAFGLKSPIVFHPTAAQYFAFSAYPLAILGSSAANLYRGDHLRARPFPVDHGHGGDTAWMLRYGHETRLCLTPFEGATFCIHGKKAASDLLDYDATLLREISKVQKSGNVSDLLRVFIDQELPIVIACRSLRSRLRQPWNHGLPIAIRLGPWAWANLLLWQQRVKLFFCRSRIRRQIQAGMAQFPIGTDRRVAR